MLIKEINKSLFGQLPLPLLLCALFSTLTCSAAVLYEDAFSTDTIANYEKKWSYGTVSGAWSYDGTAKEIDYSDITDSSTFGGGILVTKTTVFDNDFADGDHYRVSAKISFRTTTAYHAGLVFGVDTATSEGYGLIINNHKLQVGRFNAAFADASPTYYDEFKTYNSSYPGVDTLYFTVDVVKNGSTTVMNASVFDGSNTYEGSYTDNSVTFGGGQIGFWAREDYAGSNIYSFDNLTFETVLVPEPSAIGLMAIALIFLRKRMFCQIQNA